MSLDRREEQLRRALLDYAKDFADRSDDGWTTGSKLAIAARDDSGHGVDGDEQCNRLLADLIKWGLVAEKVHRDIGGVASTELRHRYFRATEKGWKLWLGEISMPGVADRRSR